MRFLTVLFILLIPVADAQTPPPATPQPVVLENSGKPLVIPFHCSDDDIQWAGLTCPANDPCPVYLELSSVEAVGPEHIFVAGNLHSPAVTLYSTVLSSDDAGRTWQETAPRVRGAVLERIEFLDAENGWVSGHSVSPLPQDPFLLATTDGGKTWRMTAIFPESAENRLGVIQQFSFSARDNGSLIIDRGQGSDEDRWELYESPDGGASWSIRQTSASPLRLKRPVIPSPDWRLRADARTKAFQVEHRQAGSWVSVAAFAVGAGACTQTP